MSYTYPANYADITTQTLALTVSPGYEAMVTVDFSNRSTTTVATVELWVVPSGETIGNEHLKEPLTTLGLAGTNQAVLTRKVIAPAGAMIYVRASTSSVSCQITTDTVSPDNTESALTTAIDAVEELIPTIVDVTKSPYNAAGDGTTDDTSAIQAAITANYGKCLYFPPGTYKVTSTLSVAGAITFQGAGRDQSYISWTSTTLQVITVASASSVHFRDLAFSGPASATAGWVISLAHSSSGTNYFSSFQDCLFSNGYDQIKTVSAAAWTIRNCYFSAFVRRAVTVTNSNAVDAGDSEIYGNCVFSNGIAGSTAIYHTSSGGLKVIGNKFNGLGSYAYQMQLASGATTSILVFANNSVENQTVSAMKFDTDGGGATYTQVVITGNQFALHPYFIDMSTATAFLTLVTITGNSFALNASGTYAINMGAVNKYLITGNQFNGGGGTPTGILLGASCSEGQIGPNNYDGLTTNVNDSSTSKAKVYFNSTQVYADGLQFPSTQVASADANCLDDYEEGTWTPVITFATPGNLAVTYTTQLGFHTKIGNLVIAAFNVLTSAFTHTTASGALQITGLPYTVSATSGNFGISTLYFHGITKAGYTQFVFRAIPGGVLMDALASGSGVTSVTVDAADCPTGGTVLLRGTVMYRV